MDNNFDATFKKIKQLLNSDPFVPFILRSDTKDIEVSHPNAIAFHPEVPFVTVYDKTEIYDLPIEKIAFVQRQHVHEADDRQDQAEDRPRTAAQGHGDDAAEHEDQRWRKARHPRRSPLCA